MILLERISLIFSKPFDSPKQDKFDQRDQFSNKLFLVKKRKLHQVLM